MKTLLVALGLAVAVIAIVLAVNVATQQNRNTTAVVRRSSQPPATQENIHIHEYAAKGRVPAFYATAPDVASLPPTLSPELFAGNKRLAYQVAKDIPQTLAQLPCYCHCDRGHNHKSLHSCFESEHGENCGICIGEALMAHTLHKQGTGIGEIRKQIIAAYGRD